MSTIILTGIKPTGDPHLGNYLGAIQPAQSLAMANPLAKKFFFIADYHALTALKDAETMRTYRHVIAATWLAFFSDIEDCYFYFQSSIPEIFELYWILSCFCPKGLLNRAHAYKTITNQNSAKGKDLDDTINHGLFSYPVLMAADILLFGATHIPVGKDQKQHVEIAVDIVQHINRYLISPIPIPTPVIQENSDVIIGIDGQKMSKNYSNTLPLFAPESSLKKVIGKIKTDSTPLGKPLNPDTCLVFNFIRHIVPTNRLDDIREQYESGTIGYGHAKQSLLNEYLTYFDAPRRRFESLMETPDIIHQTLAPSTAHVQSIATDRLLAIRNCLGF